jgi:hypothetical protein
MSARLGWLQRTAISLALGGLIGCNSLTNLGIAVPYLGEPPLSAIANLREREKGSIVVIQGTVGQSAPFIGSAAYQVQDKTGTIWIRTTNPVPPPGKTITIRGKIDYQSILVDNLEVGEIYLVEVEQLETVSQSPIEPPVQAKPKKDGTDELFLPHKRYE